MSRQVLELSGLTEFLVETLRSTDDVKNLLQSQCDEAKFVLAPWKLETITKRELDIDSCTCVAVLSSEDHVKEIASGIDKAVAQARQLREKVALNVLEEKKLARRPSVRQIYAPGFREMGSKIKTVDSKGGKENGWSEAYGDNQSSNGNMQVEVGMERNGTCAMDERKQAVSTNRNSLVKKKSKILNAKGNCTAGERDTKSSVETTQSSSSIRKISESKKIVDKKLIGTSPYNSLVAASKTDQKSKGKKNFIAANKSSLKNMKTTSSKSVSIPNLRNEVPKKLVHGSDSSATAKSSDSPISRATSAAELENLISRISLESENRLLKSSTNLVEGNGCPVHDVNAPKYVEEKIWTSMDLAEGLDRFGIPSELVKVLKVYHSYLNSDSSSKPSDKRADKAVQRFLTEFQTMNRARQKVSTREKLENLCKDFLPVLNESCKKSVDFIELSKLKIRYTDLDSICKILRIQSFSPTKRKISNMIENRCAKNWYECATSWKLNAVWNEAYIPSLEGMSRARCIRYAKKSQLLMLFDFMQQIQQLKYRASLVDLLINEVVPSVRDSLEPTSAEYTDIYKMISIVSNLLHPSVPVLVRTDK